MRRRVLSLLLALTLCVGLAVPALAANETGSYHVSLGGHLENQVYIVNSQNELWEFNFPKDSNGAVIPAKSRKVADNVKQIDAGIPGRILKTDGKTYTLDLKETGISDVASLGGGRYYITNNGDLMEEQSNGCVLVDTDVKTCVNGYIYVKNNGEMYRISYDGASFLLDNVEKVFANNYGRPTYFAITTDGSLYAWGETSDGQTGVSSTAPTFQRHQFSAGGGTGFGYFRVSEPTFVLGNVDRVITDNMSPIQTHVVTTDGVVLTWGGGNQLDEPDIITPKEKAENQWMAETLLIYPGQGGMRVHIPRRVIQYANGTIVIEQTEKVDIYHAHTFTVNMTLAGLAEKSTPTPDAPSTWAIDAAKWIEGYPEIYGWFYDYWQYEICRDEFAAVTVTMVEEALGKSLSAAPASTFTDTSDSYVLKAYQAGIVTGTSATTFSPDDSLTREQLATMLFRAIKYIENKTGKTVLTQTGTLDKFTDKGQISSWATDAVASLAANDIMKGTGETTLSPKSTATIEQALVLALRVLDGLK